MELEKVTDKTSYDFYMAGEPSHAHVIRVWRGLVNKKFNPDRTCRMIEKMEEMFEFYKKISTKDARYNLQMLKDNIYNIRDTVDYIEHDQPTETPLEILKTLREYYKKGASLSVMDNYWEQIDKVIEGGEK